MQYKRIIAIVKLQSETRNLNYKFVNCLKRLKYKLYSHSIVLYVRSKTETSVFTPRIISNEQDFNIFLLACLHSFETVDTLSDNQ